MTQDSWATEKISEWLNNDSTYYDMAQSIATSAPDEFPDSVRKWLDGARGENSAAGWTRRNLSDAQLEDGVNWAEVIADLLSE